MPTNKKIGLVVRCDNGGLGSLSQSFYKHLPIAKTLVVFGNYQNFPERFPDGIVCDLGSPTLKNIDDFLEGLDTILTFETPYNWNLFSRAKAKGIKTILMPMFEWTDEKPPVEPDLYLCPSELEYRLYPENKIWLPVPVDREEHPFKLRTEANTFIFNNGHGGSLGRNGLREFLEAVSMVALDAKFIVRSQVSVGSVIIDPRVEFRVGESKREDLFNEGDMFVFPHKFDGLSLPIQEAMSAGLPVITTDFFPHNNYLPKELLFEPEGFGHGRVGKRQRVIEMAILSPKKMALKIEEFIGKDITELSQKMNDYAESISWDKLKDKYLEIL